MSFSCSELFPKLWAKEFFLLVSFGRCKYQLTDQSAGSILHTTLKGGVMVDFRLQQIAFLFR
jgi:hypothetical protein